MPDPTPAYDYDSTCPECGGSGIEWEGFGFDCYCRRCDMYYRSRIVYEVPTT